MISKTYSGKPLTDYTAILTVQPTILSSRTRRTYDLAFAVICSKMVRGRGFEPLNPCGTGTSILRL